MWSLILRAERTMKTNRFTEQQIIGLLQELEAGVEMAEVCRKQGIAKSPFFQVEGKVQRYGCF